MKVMLGFLVMGACVGIGAFWAFALNCNVLYGMAIGGIIGIPIGLSAKFLLGVISKMSNTGTKFIGILLVIPTILLFLFTGVGIGLLMWLIRVIFF